KIKEKMVKHVCGIDLGTTYSCVGVFENNRVEIISNDQGNRTTPSWVSFGQERLIGEAAKNQVTLNPENTVFDAKRFIGRNFDDPNVQKDRKHLTSNVVDVNGKPHFEVTFMNEKKVFSPEEISAMILGKMKSIAESYVGEPITDCVITVPAYFNDACRQATKDAGVIAGLNVLRIINEPTAAAIAYGLDKLKDGKERNILIFDCGGGTHDVSLLNLCDGIFEVKATSGDTHLGGEDLDHLLVDYCVNEFKKKHKTDISGEKRAKRRLQTACERAKRTLSSATTAHIEIDSLFQGIDFSLTITRAKFEDLGNSFFQRTLAPVKKVLEDSKLSKSEIDDIVLVGGTTRIPKIQSLLKDFFGKDPHTGINQDECVAYGATVQAAVLAGIESEQTSNILLLDCTPLSLGIETAGDIMTVLIPRGTTIPSKKTQTFSTYSDNQPSATIKILEGERYKSKDNNVLGSFQLDNIPPMPRGIPKIHVTYDISADGILNVSAEVENAEGVKKSLTISNDSNRLTKEQIDKMVKEAEQFKEMDEKLKEVVDAKNQYESVLYQNKGQLDGKEGSGELLTLIQKELDWLESNQNQLTKEEIQKRQDTFLETVLSKTKDASSPDIGKDSFSFDDVPMKPPSKEETVDGVKIEEID
ncbi:MAG: molecular chaperone DnaK, partial [Planctomycetia bacterium]|nr:molecular chaperone DnaK [Planctomycetia bacterium]